MSEDPLDSVSTLAFDIFGTVLDLGQTLAPAADRLLTSKGARIGGEAFWEQWRARQRIEQYQDTLMMLGHSGYLETCRRALVYCLRQHGVKFADPDIEEVMSAYRTLEPFADAERGLERLKGQYRLVALSNGDRWLLEHLAANQIRVGFDAVVSVDEAGVFKPHPAVYRTAARALGAEPHEIMMVAAHSFDVIGARASGYRGAYVNRYGLPFDAAHYLPDLEVNDFLELAGRLLDGQDARDNSQP
jgi:2-haloacid dehalogenase